MSTFRFSDHHDNESVWSPDDARSAFDAFSVFIDAHKNDDGQSFRIDADTTGESLIVSLDTRVISRLRTDPNEQVEYRLVDNNGDYRKCVSNFVLTGYTGLDRHGPWFPDVASLERARIRRRVEESVLRRTHPQELRRRLSILAAIDGNEVRTADGVTHYGFGNGAGDTVNAWFTSAGRGLLITFDHESELNAYENPDANAAHYAGVPDDLAALARNVPDSETMLAADHPDGGTLAAATGVFHFSAPVTMAEGLVTRLQDNSADVEATGLPFLVESFLQIDDFNPDTLAAATAWWGHEDIAQGFATHAAVEAKNAKAGIAPETEAKLVERFCEIWGDNGCNDRWGVHHILFDTYDRTGVDEAELADVLEAVKVLGLERVDSPAGSESGEVWVRVDPRIDAELEFYS